MREGVCDSDHDSRLNAIEHSTGTGRRRHVAIVAAPFRVHVPVSARRSSRTCGPERRPPTLPGTLQHRTTTSVQAPTDDRTLLVPDPLVLSTMLSLQVSNRCRS